MLLLAARANGVDVVGAWECRSDELDPDLEVLVTELQRGGSGEG